MQVFPFKYIDGLRFCKQLVQLVKEILQVAHGLIQIKQTLVIFKYPVKQLRMQLFPDRT